MQFRIYGRGRIETEQKFAFFLDYANVFRFSSLSFTIEGIVYRFYKAQIGL